MKIPVFLNNLQEVLKSQDARKKTQRKGDDFRHYPSSASLKLPSGKVIGSCLRSQFYRSKDTRVTNPPDFNGYLRMGLGDGIHQWVLSRLQKVKGMVIMPQSGGRTVIDPLTKQVSFRLDALVTYQGKIGGLQLKTVNSRAFSYMQGRPKDDHLLQCISYFGLNPAIDWFSLVYLGRDNGYVQQFHITKDGDKFFCQGVFPKTQKYQLVGYSFAGIIQRWSQLQKHLKSDTEPSRDFKVVFDKDGQITDKRQKAGKVYKSDPRCLYCPYLQHCWEQPGAQSDAVFIPMTQTQREEYKSKVVS